MDFALVAENDTAPFLNNGDESVSVSVKALEDTRNSRPQSSSSGSIRAYNLPHSPCEPPLTKRLPDLQESRPSPSSISQSPPASDPANDANPAAFVDRILMVPPVNSILRAYEQIKTSSEVVKVRCSPIPLSHPSCCSALLRCALISRHVQYGAEMMESFAGTILRLVISLLPVAQLDEFACRQLDRVRTSFFNVIIR